MRRRALAVPVLLVGALAGCTDAGDPTAAPSTAAPSVVTAERVLQVTEVHETTGMTLLEGPTFGPDGSLYVVDVTAPPDRRFDQMLGEADRLGFALVEIARTPRRSREGGPPCDGCWLLVRLQ